MIETRAELPTALYPCQEHKRILTVENETNRGRLSPQFARISEHR